MLFNMEIKRREFLGGAAAMGAVVMPRLLRAQEGSTKKMEVPTYKAKVEKLFKTPDRYPNALETTPEALWVGDQVSERINKLDWKTGKVLADFVAEAHNTSGIAVGGGYLWIGCNGAGTAASKRKFDRPFDRQYGEIVKCDMNTGKQIKGYKSPWGSTHGTAWAHDTEKLWVAAPSQRLAMELDPKDDLRILRMVSLNMDTPHGIEWYQGKLWVLAAASRVLHKIDPDSGKILEIYTLEPTDPDPHGMCIKDDYVYYCDAGLGGGRTPSPGTSPQLICRFPLNKG
jgi:streptogramin lyase